MVALRDLERKYSHLKYTGTSQVRGDRSMPIEEGKAAPAFTLKDQNGDTVKLSAFRGEKNVVLFAYPKAMTPGCTVESKDFSRLLPKFEKHDTVVLGISADSVERQKKFEEKESLCVPLLSDADHKVMEKYSFWGEKKNYGKVYEGIIRSTVVIDKKGKVAKLMRNVRAKNHAEKVLAFVEDNL